MSSRNRVSRIVETVAVGAILALAAFAAFAEPPTMSEWVAAAFFSLFGVVAAALAYPTSRVTAGTISFLPYLSAALVAPNIAALAAVVVSTLAAEVILRRPLQKLVFNTAQHTFAVALGIALFVAAGGRSTLEENPAILPFVLLVATYFVVNKLAVSTVVAHSSASSTYVHWLKSMKGSAVYDALSMPLIIFFAIAYSRIGPSWTAILALPMLGIRQLYRTVFALEKVNEELLQLMVASIEARDPYTSGHSQRVSRCAREIAKSAGLGARQIERVEIAALLHDVGKIHEEFATILRKPGRLTDEEFSTMKMHPIRSAELVAKVTHFADLVAAVRGHHEAWNGTGYPDQLRSDRIPLAARIIAIADTIDAMTTSRPYRAGRSLDQVRDELIRESGKQFDPTICAKLIEPSVWNALEIALGQAQTEFPSVESHEYGAPHAGNTGEFVTVASRS